LIEKEGNGVVPRRSKKQRHRVVGKKGQLPLPHTGLTLRQTAPKRRQKRKKRNRDRVLAGKQQQDIRKRTVTFEESPPNGGAPGKDEGNFV